jgi:hypothetical protein
MARILQFACIFLLVGLASGLFAGKSIGGTVYNFVNIVVTLLNRNFVIIIDIAVLSVERFRGRLGDGCRLEPIYQVDGRSAMMV